MKCSHSESPEDLAIGAVAGTMRAVLGRYNNDPVLHDNLLTIIRYSYECGARRMRKKMIEKYNLGKDES